MKVTINREFLRRHLFALVVVAGLGLWFGYDGAVTYPRLSPAQLYASIERVEPPKSMTDEKLEAFKSQKIKTQYGLSIVLLLAAVGIGAHLVGIARFDFAFDEEGFAWRGRRYAYTDIRKVDRSAWTKKGILRLTLSDGVLVLDSWHHSGVAEFEKKI